MSRLAKVYNKSKHFHKHGEHGSKLEINRKLSSSRTITKVESIDITKQNWSAK